MFTRFLFRRFKKETPKRRILSRAEKEPCIYQIRNLLTGDIYIGSALKGIAHRKSVHLHHLRYNKHHSPILQNAWNKYGERNFIFEIVEPVKGSYDDLLDIEQKYLDLLLPKYNIEKKARGHKHSEFARNNMKGHFVSEESKEKNRRSHLGRTHTQETKQKMSDAHKGKIKTAEHRTNLSKSHAGFTGPEVLELRKLFRIDRISASELARRTGVSSTCIYNIVTGKTYKHLPMP